MLLLRRGEGCRSFILNELLHGSLRLEGGESQAKTDVVDPEGYKPEADRSQGHLPFKSFDHLWTRL